MPAARRRGPPGPMTTARDRVRDTDSRRDRRGRLARAAACALLVLGAASAVAAAPATATTPAGAVTAGGVAAPGFAPSLTAVTFRGGSEVDVFWRTTADGIAQSRRSGPALVWTTAATVPGTAGAATTAPAATVAGPAVDVVWRGADGGVWEQAYSDATGWSPAPVELPGSAGTATSAPAIVTWGADAEVLWRTTDGAILIAGHEAVSAGRPAGGWQLPERVPGTAGRAASTPAAVVARRGSEIDVLWRGTDGAIWETYDTAAGGWRAGPFPVPGTVAPPVTAPAPVPGAALAAATAPAAPSPRTVTSAPAVTASRGDGEVDVFWRAADGSVSQVAYRTGDNAWTRPATVRGTASAPSSSAPAAVAVAPAAGGPGLDVLFRGTDGGIWSTGYRDGTGWPAAPAPVVTGAGALPRSQLDLAVSTAAAVSSGAWAELPTSDGVPETHAPMGITLDSDVLPSGGAGGLLCSAAVSATACGGENESPLFQYLLSSLGLRYARIFTPYDTASTVAAAGSGCAAGTPPSVYEGRAAWQVLHDRLVAARAAGLTPVVVLTKGAGPLAFPDPTTPRGYWAYRCAVQGLVAVTQSWGLPVNRWEAFNEPDAGYPGPPTPYQGGAHAGPCPIAGPPTGATSLSGPGKAACLWEIFQHADDQPGDQIAAGTFDYNSVNGFAAGGSNPWVTAYVNTLLANRAAGLPRYVSFHPYDDVTEADATAASGTARLTAYLKGALGPEVSVWLTEASDWLPDPHDARTNGDPAAQAAASEAFLTLPTVSALPVTQEYWYQVQADWSGDYALVDNNFSLRTSYCVLAFGMTAAAAVSTPGCADPAAARDWSLR